MDMNDSIRPTMTEWMGAKGLMPNHTAHDGALECALVPDTGQDNDHIAVVYNKGECPPEITIEQVSGTVHKVCANGIAVAVVASAAGPAPKIDDVLLVERFL